MEVEVCVLRWHERQPNICGVEKWTCVCVRAWTCVCVCVCGIEYICEVMRFDNTQYT